MKIGGAHFKLELGGQYHWNLHKNHVNHNQQFKLDNMNYYRLVKDEIKLN
jgi:hypothetical protein